MWNDRAGFACTIGVGSSNRIWYWQGTMVIPHCLQPRGSAPTVGFPQAASGLLCMGWKCISRKRVLEGISKLIRRPCSRLLFYDWGTTKCVDQWRISESAVCGANHQIWSRYGGIMISSSFSKGCMFFSMCNWRIQSWSVQAACSKISRFSWPKCLSLQSTHMWVLTEFTFSFTKERIIRFYKDVPSTCLAHMKYVCLIRQSLALRMDSKITSVTMRLDTKHKSPTLPTMYKFLLLDLQSLCKKLTGHSRDTSFVIISEFTNNQPIVIHTQS